MGYSFRTTLRNYKSYRSKWFDISMSSNGSDPQTVVVKVFNSKKPKAEVIVYVGSFSESQGVGFSSGKSIIVTDAEAVALCAGTLVDDTGIAPLIDKLTENGTTGRVLTLLARWWVLANQQYPSQFIDNERKSKAFDNKKFAVGDTVEYRDRYGMNPQTGVITSERFEWTAWNGTGWVYSMGNSILAEQGRFRKVEQLAEAVA